MSRQYSALVLLVFVCIVYAKKCTNCDLGRGFFTEDPIESDLPLGPQNKFGDTSYSVPLEAEFDSRKQWPQCNFLIHDVGKCKGAEIFQAEVASLSFRYCVKGKPANLSLQAMVSCDSGDYGCHGGYFDRSWKYLENEGVVSEQCFPFISNTARTPYCPVLKECPGGKEKWETYKCKPRSIRRFTDEKKLKREIKANGPVMAMFEVREDLLKHKDGMYVCRQDERAQTFLIVIGWGEEKQGKYWLCLSARGKSPGDDGVIKMRMGGYCPKLAHAMTCEPEI